MDTESDREELKGAVGELARAVMELADAVDEGAFSDDQTRRVAVSVSKTARRIANQCADSGVFGAVAVPEDVVALVRAGKTVEAATRYRAVTGATLDEAMAALRDIT